ncbi:MAG: C2 family cysteine protease [Bacillota bacterium]|nr:C2 family cysteine protease [Bacillota bacterium]
MLNIRTKKKDIKEPSNTALGAFGKWTKTDDELFPHEPSPNDIKQGVGVQDCFILSSLSYLAHKDPEKIKEAMKDNGDGTVTVRFYKSVNFTLKEQEKGDRSHREPVYVTVNKTVNKLAGSMNIYASSSLWVQMLEKAYIAYIHQVGVDGDDKDLSYSSINTGLADRFLQSFEGRNYIEGNHDFGAYAYDNKKEINGDLFEVDSKGQPLHNEYGQPGNKYFDREELLYSILKQSVNIDGSPVVVFSSGDKENNAKYALNNGVRVRHDYAVLGVFEKNGKKYVQVKDPYASFSAKYDEKGKLCNNSHEFKATLQGGYGSMGVFNLELRDFQRVFDSFVAIEQKYMDVFHEKMRKLPVFDGKNIDQLFTDRENIITDEELEALSKEDKTILPVMWPYKKEPVKVEKQPEPVVEEKQPEPVKKENPYVKIYNKGFEEMLAKKSKMDEKDLPENVRNILKDIDRTVYPDIDYDDVAGRKYTPEEDRLMKDFAEYWDKRMEYRKLKEYDMLVELEEKHARQVEAGEAINPSMEEYATWEVIKGNEGVVWEVAEYLRDEPKDPLEELLSDEPKDPLEELLSTDAGYKNMSTVVDYLADDLEKTAMFFSFKNSKEFVNMRDKLNQVQKEFKKGDHSPAGIENLVEQVKQLSDLAKTYAEEKDKRISEQLENGKSPSLRAVHRMADAVSIMRLCRGDTNIPMPEHGFAEGMLIVRKDLKKNLEETMENNTKDRDMIDSLNNALYSINEYIEKHPALAEQLKNVQDLEPEVSPEQLERQRQREERERREEEARQALNEDGLY